MNARELEQLVDEGTTIANEIKQLEAHLKGIKTTLKEEAKKKKSTVLTGKTGVAIFSDYSKSSIDIDDLRGLLAKNKMSSKFPDCISVNITATRKIVPASLLETFTIEKGRHSFPRLGTIHLQGSSQLSQENWN
jgi:hypothetical protein